MAYSKRAPHLSCTDIDFDVVDCKFCHSVKSPPFPRINITSREPTSLRDKSSRHRTTTQTNKLVRSEKQIEIETGKKSTETSAHSRKIYIPVNEYPHINFIGRIIGRKGKNIKEIKDRSRCKVMIRGRGSVPDKNKEASLRGKIHWAHLNEALHVLIICDDPPVQAEANLQRAVDSVNRLLSQAIKEESDSKTSRVKDVATDPNRNESYRIASKNASRSSQSGSESAQSAASCALLKNTQRNRLLPKTQGSSSSVNPETTLVPRKRSAQEALLNSSDDESHRTLPPPQSTRTSYNTNPNETSKPKPKRRKLNKPATTTFDQSGGVLPTTSTVVEKQKRQQAHTTTPMTTSRRRSDQVPTSSNESGDAAKAPLKTSLKLFGFKKITEECGSSHETTFQCFCGESFRSLTTLTGHQTARHGGLKLHACSQCRIRFQLKSSRIRHEQQKHDLYRCCKCPKIVESRCHLKKHQKEQHDNQ